MKNNNKSKDKIIKELENKLSEDLFYDSGFILGSMCSEPLSFSTEVFSKYISKNLGDPGLFPGTTKLEIELIESIGSLYGCSDVMGTITTGGTESNIMAMRIARAISKNVEKPEFVVPSSAHVSFDKGADLLGINLKKANLHEDFSLDLDHFNSLLSDKTIGIAGVAGTTALGLIDPIEQMAVMAGKKNIYFHIDAAFGGFVLPFLKDLGHNVPKWDFSVKKVNSITADPHKMGLAPIPSGGFLIKTTSLTEEIRYEIPYLAGGCFKHLNLVGTRSGASVISFWALWKFLGMKGYKEIIKECMDNTLHLEKKINEIPRIKVPVKPVMNIVGITSDDNISMSLIDQELRKKNWMLGLFNDINLLRAVIMPHVKKDHIDRFCEDLENIVKMLP